MVVVDCGAGDVCVCVFVCCVHVHMCMGGCICQHIHVEVRGQLCGIASPFTFKYVSGVDLRSLGLHSN